uniref:Uncharacterized protein n=1 Tax=Arundo donax TaxID=35708 RepID=A0A0A9BLG3_ARUDO
MLVKGDLLLVGRKVPLSGLQLISFICKKTNQLRDKKKEVRE